MDNVARDDRATRLKTLFTAQGARVTTADLHALLTDPRDVRAVVVGGGKTGAAAAQLLVQLGAQVTVVDDASDDKVRAGLSKGALDVPRVRVVAGGIDAAVVCEAQVLVLSPGVPRAHPAIAKAIAAGVPCTNEVDVAAVALEVLSAARHVAAPRVVGITGTNGKSTTTTLCGSIMRMHDAHAFVGGNLGTPYCAAALEALCGGALPRLSVLELSSYQLETLTQLKLDAAVVTNLSPDHLDRYASVDAYYAAKARIFALKNPAAPSILNAQDAVSQHHLAAAAGGPRYDFDISVGVGVKIGTDTLEVDGALMRVNNPHIVGHHNRQNAAAAVAAARALGVAPALCQRGLDCYAGIAHRLERVGVLRGVTWFNDSKGTNVDATVTAVKSFGAGVHLIAGGLGKGSSYQPLVDASRNRVVAVYTIGQDAPVIGAAFAGVVDVIACGTLEHALVHAQGRARAGDVILLSPACASFDQFRDYAHRGDSFRAVFAAALAADTAAVGA